MKRLLSALVVALLLWAQPASAAFSLIAHAACGGGGASGFTGGCSINSTNADLLLISVGQYQNQAITVTDSKSISLTCRTTVTTGSISGQTLCYAWTGSTGWSIGAGHTIAVSCSICYPGATFTAWTGALTSGDPFDVEASTGNAVAATSASVGSVTPTGGNTDLIVTIGGPDDGSAFDAATVTSFTMADREVYNNGANEPSQLWYTSASSATSATWNWSSKAYTLYIAAFKPGGGGPPPTSTTVPCTLRLLGVGCEVDR